MRIESVIEIAKIKISGAIMEIKTETGLPMYLMELVLSGILGDIRDAAARELAGKMIKEEAEERKNVELRGEQTDVHTVEKDEQTVQ